MKLPLRFSLRTLAILVTLLCITIGAPIAYIRYKAGRQRNAIARLEKLGIVVKVQDAKDEKPTWLTLQTRAWIDPDAFRLVPYARTPTYLKDLHETTSLLQSLNGLTFFHCQSQGITDDHLRQLAKIPTLVELIVNEHDEGYSTNGLRSLLTRTNWQRLYLPKADCDDNLLNELGKQTQLYHIAITASQATSEGYRELAKLKSLREAILYKPARVREFTDALSPSSPLLSLLVFDSTLSREDLASIGKLTSLRNLTLDHCQLEGSALTHFNSLTLLKLLDFCHTELAENDIDRLNGFATLSMLGLHGGIDDKNVDRLAKLQSIRALDFSATELTDEGLLNYSIPPSLKIIVLPKNTKCSVAAFRRLQEKAPVRIVVGDKDSGIHYIPGGGIEEYKEPRYE